MSLVKTKGTKSTKAMNKERILKLARTVSYIACLVLFLAWMFNAIENYLLMPTTSKVALKYGDDNRKNATFPSMTFCKIPMRVENISKIWNDASPCRNDTPLSRPYFLSYMEACLESGSKEKLSEIIDRVTYNPEEVFRSIITIPIGVSPLENDDDWKKFKNQIP